MLDAMYPKGTLSGLRPSVACRLRAAARRRQWQNRTLPLVPLSKQSAFGTDSAFAFQNNRREQRGILSCVQNSRGPVEPFRAYILRFDHYRDDQESPSWNHRSTRAQHLHVRHAGQRHAYCGGEQAGTWQGAGYHLLASPIRGIWAVWRFLDFGHRKLLVSADAPNPQIHDLPEG